MFLTFNGIENKYACYLLKKYGNIPVISFIGIKPRREIYALYTKVNSVIFPSMLETWGLPVTEAKKFNLPILLADLPYAHETVGDYDKVKFFNPSDFRELAEQMKAIINGNLAFDGSIAKAVESPFARNWEELFITILCK